MNQIFALSGHLGNENTALLGWKQGLGEGQGKEGIKRRRR
jgi:hypothetical protein